jgi:hypothetical protein
MLLPSLPSCSSCSSCSSSLIPDNNIENWEKGICPYSLPPIEAEKCKSLITKKNRVSSEGGGFRTQESCLCRAGIYYTDDSNSTNEVCRACPEGANCGRKDADRDGLTLKEILPLPGWWRASGNSSEFLDCRVPYMIAGKEVATALARERCCPSCNITEESAQSYPNSSSFFNNTNAACLVGYDGPYCASCNSSGDFLKWGNNCTYCRGGASIAVHIGMWFGVGALVVVGVCSGFLMLKPPKNEDQAAKRDALMSNGKILWDWGQLFSSTPNTFGEIAWGETFSEMAAGLGSLVSLDVAGPVLGFSSCSFNLPHMESFLMFMFAVPVLYFVAIPIGTNLAKYIHRENPKRVAFMENFELKVKTNYLQILYPSVCGKVFSIFDCVEIPGLPAGESMQLRASLDVTCWTSKDSHLFFFGWAIFFLFVYVLAFPGVLFFVLYQNREALHDEDHPNHKRVAKSYSMFYDSYEDDFYWFECCVILRKLMLTGMLSLSTFFFFLAILLRVVVVFVFNFCCSFVALRSTFLSRPPSTSLPLPFPSV